MHRFTRLVGALALVLSVPIAATVMAARPFNDPIIGAAHGAVFGPGGKEIHVTAEFVVRAQQIYLSHVLDSANAAQRAAYLSKRTYLDDIARGTPADLQSALMARSLLLDWLIDEVGPIDSGLLKQRNRILEWALQTGAVSADGTPYSMPPSAAATFSQLGLPVAALVAAGTPPSDEVLQAREAYAKLCRKKGVPIPPTWGTGGPTGWTSKGRLTTLFISEDKEAELFVHQSTSPQGVCLALPRYASMPEGSPAILLGIICMGTGVDLGSGIESNACFWDNQKDQRGVPIPRTGGEFPINTNFAAGAELDGGTGGTCTKCHEGENAYIVHPRNTAFKNLANLEPKAYYKPIVAASWPQNSGPNMALEKVAVPADEKKCITCHEASDHRRLPAIVKEIATPTTENYCDNVLRPAILKTMPPSSASRPDARYQTHIDFLEKACTDAAGP